MLNPLLIVACVCIVIALILYLFYWNRLLAWIIGFVLHIMYWNQGGSSIWVEFGSIHCSLIAGRILLKDFTYHSSNQTVRIAKVQVEWRYWLRRPMMEEDVVTSLGMDEHKLNRRPHSCRVQVKLQGFQWFMYNRTPSFDTIIDQLMQDMPQRTTTFGTEARMSMSKASVIPSFQAPPFVKRFMAWLYSQLPNLDPKDLLPLGIAVTKGIIIIGNKSTLNLLLAEFKHTEGIFGVVQSRSKHDLYKQILNLKFQAVLVRYMENKDYSEPMAVAGASLQASLRQFSKYEDAPHPHATYQAFAKLWRQYWIHAPKPRSTEKGHNTHKEKMHDTSENPSFADSDGEYAVERKILEAPVFELSYYADVVGEVPPLSEQTEPIGVESFDIGNGGLSPQWGVDIIVRNAFIRYGPWADRQRAELQRAFFPPPYHDVLPTHPLNPGDRRVWTNMRVFIELLDETTLHVPFREPSKNWQWDEHNNLRDRRRKREPAAIHLVVGDRSSINYTLPMVVGPEGYNPLLEIHLDTVEVTSSLNDIRLVAAESCRIRGEMPSPLKWDAERKWSFGVTLRQPVIYLIRDHINMITDLVRDWTSGPPHDYYRFVPTVYGLEFELHHYALNLYVNDHNIIDKPLIKEENALLTLHGSQWKSEVLVPSNKFRPDTTCIPFSFDIPNLALNLSLPRWNTNALHAPKEGDNVGHIVSLRIDASYRYYSDVKEENIEQLKLNFKARQIAFKALGWAVRHFMLMRENYFGTFTHFSTLWEYLDRRKRGIAPGDPVEAKYRPGQSNAFQVEVAIVAEDSITIVPAGLPGYETSNTSNKDKHGLGTCVVMAMPQLQLHLRVTEYYMEMSLNIDPVACYVMKDFPNQISRRSFKRPKQDSLLIDGINVIANRLFGPQPRTATYLCIWEIQIGDVKGALSAWDGQALGITGRLFAMNYVDAANAPASEYMPALDPDVTIVKASLRSFELTWRAEPAVLVVSLPKGIKVDNNDKPGKFHKKVTSVRMPYAHFKLLYSTPSTRKAWLETASLSIDVDLDLYSAPKGWQTKAEIQEKFIALQDCGTDRARRMLAQYERTYRRLHQDGFYLPQPRISTVSAPPITTYPRVASQTAARAVSGAHRWSRLSHLSESEGEEGISEAARDARLAKSRSDTPVLKPTNEDDLNMTSGDESDDEDLTADSSDSDWSEASSPNTSDDFTLLRMYLPYVRRYGSRPLDIPGLWDGCPFFVLKDPTPRVPPITSHFSSPLYSIPTNSEKLPLLDTHVIRLESRQGLQLHLTPLAVQALTCLQDQSASTSIGPELLVDTIIASRMGRIPYVPQKNSNLVLDASISVIRIRFLQHVNLLRGGTSMLSLSLDWDKCHVTGCGTTDQPSFKLGISAVTLSLEPAVEGKSPSANDSGISLTCTGFNAGFADHQIEATWEAATTEISHQGPGYIIATSLALQHSVQPIPEIFSRHASHRSLTTQRMVHDIVYASNGKPMVDSLSTFQPSYLIQSGISRDLRNDSTIRFLFHLRSCLHFIEPKDRQGFLSLRNDAQNLSMRDTLSMLESRLKDLALDGDSPSFNSVRTLEETLFPNRKHLVPPPSRRIVVRAVNICFGNTSLAILDSDCISASNLTISTLSLLVDFRHCAFASRGSQTSLIPGTTPVRKVSVKASAEGISLTVQPYLLSFTQHVLHVRAHYAKNSPMGDAPSTPKQRSTANPSPLYVSVVLSVNKFGVHAAAQNLIFELDLCGVEVITTALALNTQQSVNSSVKFQDIILRARSPAVSSKGHDRDILASLTLNQGAFSLILNQEPKATSSLALVFMLGGISVRVPRSALRLYRFVEEWRADFLPGIEGMAQALLQELKNTSNSSRPPKTAPNPFNYRINGKVLSTQVSLQVMHGMWLSWDVQGTFAHFKSSSITKRSHIAFGAQLPSQTFTISSNSTDLRDTLTRVQVAVPQITIAGSHDGTCIHILTLVEEFRAKVKPSHWDTLLAVQQKFGQDFSEFLALVQKTQTKRASATQPTAVPSPPMKYVTDLKVKGFRLGLEGLSSTLFLECSNIYGSITNVGGLSWQMDLSDLALSLAPRAALDPRYTAFSRNHRSAFVIVDVSVGAKSVHLDDQMSEDLKIEVLKVHAVMQPSSIGEVGDFIDHLQAEMLERREQRALEVAAFKERTRQLWQTFEAPAKESPSIPMSPWFNSFNVDISIRQIGVAFPLTLDQELEMPRSGRGSNAFRAFLISIKSICFGAQRGETGQASIAYFSFQFVPKFQQSVAADFVGENHTTRNRLMYPEMTAHLRSETTLTSRKVWVVANINGFILDVESSIPDYVFSLIDVYRQGKDRVVRLSANLPPASLIVESPRIEDQAAPKQYTAIPTSNISGSLTFRSGVIRIHSGSQLAYARSRSFTHPPNDSLDDHLSESGETVRLPVVSVWAEYRATPATRKMGSSAEPEPSTLVFKSTIHSSENTLKPTLLPFITELTSHVETRMRKISGLALHPDDMTASSSFSNAIRSESAADSVSSMQISFSLRIDQSKLELTCQPDVNVIAGLHWESGGFMINISPGARQVTLSGTVGGLTIGLKHGFLSEDCVKLDVHNLAFSVAFSKMESLTKSTVNSLSIILDTEFSGAVHFSRLQDVLCFKAVWLDRIPILKSESSIASSSMSKEPAATTPTQDLTTSVLVRVRRIILDVDLGHSISAITLDLKDSYLRTQVTELDHEVSISVSNVSLQAKGNVSGNASVPRCVFQTIRRCVIPGTESVDNNRRLELHMTSGSLVATLESEHQRIMHYRAEPLDIEVSDDWSMVLAGPQAQDRPLLLSFTISGTEIVAATTVGAIPKLMSYANKFRANLQAQRDGASRESKTFRITRTPKPDNALSTVANAMISSARQRFKEETGLSYVIKQHISLQLDSLRLVVFPRTIHDLELARFVALDVLSRLDRLVESETIPAQKDLHLSFSSMTISRFSQLNPRIPIEAAQMDSKEWLSTLLKDASEATIVGLPSMTMHMVSTEKPPEDPTKPVKLIVYDFDSKFIRRAGMKDLENIYITLNVSLYSWLTLLRKNFTREMDQIRATSEWRSSVAMTSPPVITGRRKTPESLQLSTFESPRSAVTSPRLSLQQPTSAGVVAGAVKRLTDTERMPRSATYESSTPLSTSTPTRNSSMVPFPQPTAADVTMDGPPLKLSNSLVYQPRSRSIERLTMRQLGEATPDVMHPFFMKKSGFNLEDALPQYVNEYATAPLEEIMEVLLKVYSRQLLVEHSSS